MARILIAGCGDVGATLGQSLSAAGHEVWGLKRRPANLPPGIRPLAADLTEPATLNALPPVLDAVVYSAAAAGFGEAAYRAAYVAGVQNLLDALRRAGQQPHRLLFASSTSVYAQHQGEWVDEDSPAEAEGFSGRCIRAGERLMWDGGWPAVAVRFGGIYGPGRTRLIDSVRAGTAARPAGPPLYTNRIHRDDCARVLEHLLFAAGAGSAISRRGRRPGAAGRGAELAGHSTRRAGTPAGGESTPETGRRIRRSRAADAGQQALPQRPVARQRLPVPLSQLPGRLRRAVKRRRRLAVGAAQSAAPAKS